MTKLAQTAPKPLASVQLIVEGKTYEYPSFQGTEGEKAFDVSKLRDQTGYVTFDNGFANTAPCTSAITFLDGDKGILSYRGYPIEELAAKASFIEVAYILLFGRKPANEELQKFNQAIAAEAKLEPQFTAMLDAFPKNAHPMAMLSAMTVGLSSLFPNDLDPANDAANEKNIARLLGIFPLLCAYAYRHAKSKTRIPAKKGADYPTNFLHLMFADNNDYQPAKEAVEALNLLLILHADHEQNCSTSSVRLVGSSAANLYASIASGINALWGPLHGGANQAVMEMLEEIHKDGGDVSKYVALAKDKKSSFRLMGFGHRVYKNFDPRAKIIKKACDNVLEKMGVHNPLLDLAKKLEEAALTDSYFIEKKLYPNVDFYSGIIYSALNIPVEMFTPMFALGRLPGWIAQWKEMVDGGTTKIARPRQIYVGENKRAY